MIVSAAMKRAENILSKNVDLLHKLSKELLEREILDSEEIDKIIKGETLPPISRDGNGQHGDDDKNVVPEHVKKLLDQRKQKDTALKDDAN